MKIKIISITIFLLLVTLPSLAKPKQKITVKGGADIVSYYVWRGSYNAGASFQPALSAGIAGVTLGAWGSMDFIGQGRKEIDLSLNYSIKGFTVGVTDYWWEGEGKFNYFHYADCSTSHRWEANLAYQLPVAKFPLIISWNTMFAGADYDVNGNRSYSTYIELFYPFKSGKVVDMTALWGASLGTHHLFYHPKTKASRLVMWGYRHSTPLGVPTNS